MRRSEIPEILQKSKVIAVVGLSRDPEKAGHRVSLYVRARMENQTLSGCSWGL